jgi:hypothetical protein
VRIHPPPSFKLTAEALLQDVRARLDARSAGRPEVGRGDPTDPGWLLLEQAAWMVEQLSSQLDEYPVAVLQQLLHLLGAKIRPAAPALGVVALGVRRGGVLDWDPLRPPSVRLFRPQSEQSRMIEFAPAERGMILRQMQLASLTEIREGELWRAARPLAEDALVAERDTLVPSRAFHREQVRYRFVAANPPELKALLESAINRLGENRIGWLKLRIDEVGPRGLTLVATIDPAAAFASAAPTGLTVAGDMVGDWGVLDDSTWTPRIRVANESTIPVRLRGREPLPAAEARIVFPNMAANLPLEGLFTTKAAPIPTSVCVAIWNTLTHVDTRLAQWKPSVQRVYDVLAHEEPQWLAGAIDGELWYRFSPGPTTVIHVRLPEADLPRVRVGIILEHDDAERLPEIRVFAEEPGGVIPDVVLPHRVAFRLPCPSTDAGRGMEMLVVLDVEVGPQSKGILVAVVGSIRAALANPMLVVQAPPVRDGRIVDIARNIPEAASLLHPDVVGPDVIESLLAEPLAPDARALVEALPLAVFHPARQEPILDFAGVAVDSAAGQVTFNGIDRQGRQRSLRRGDRVDLRWYRRTDGDTGNVPAGALRLVEQDGGPGPLLTSVTNPRATFFGASRETDQAAIDRLFGPPDATPVLPADFERLVRHALGPRGEGWEVRCWTYAERALVTTALWPPPRLGVPADDERTRLESELVGAGPDHLLVLLGPTRGEISLADLDWARQAVRGLCARIGRRVPTVRDAVVGRLWPLRLETEAAPLLNLPCFAVEGLPGTLVDERGRRAAPPRGLLLNGAVVEVGVPRRDGSA